MEKESQDVVKMGIELIVGSIFLLLVVGLMITANHWYAREEYTKYQIQLSAREAPNWTFEDRAKNVLANEHRPTDKKLPETVQGNDIINFIVRNGSDYEYVIGTGYFDGEKPEEQTDPFKLTETQCKNIGSNVWLYKNIDSDGNEDVERYSEKTDITKYNFSSRDKLKYTQGETPSINEAADSSSKDTGVRVYGKDLINRRAERKQEILEQSGKNIDYDALGLDIYSENYLLNVAGLRDHLECNFRVIKDVSNGETIRWYFLHDPEAKSPDDKAR